MQPAVTPLAVGIKAKVTSRTGTCSGEDLTKACRRSGSAGSCRGVRTRAAAVGRSNSLQTLLELQGQLEGVDPDALDDLVTEALERVFGGGDKIRPAPDPDAPLE